MRHAVLFSIIRRSLAQFRQADSGNIAPLFAIVILPLLAFVGAAIDYTRVNNARTAMQAALDSAALMISKDASSLTSDQISQKAQDYFQALYNHPEVNNVTITATYSPSTGSGASIVMSGSGTMPTDFLQVVGYPDFSFNVGTTTKWASTRMRVAIALDDTGSMADAGKMPALQSAAKDMISQLANYSTNPGDVYVSIVPFTKDVNVGTSNAGKSWLGWSDAVNKDGWLDEPLIFSKVGYPGLSSVKSTPNGQWEDTVGPGESCPFTTGTHGFTCTDRPSSLSGAQSASKIPSSGTYSGMICPGSDNGSTQSKIGVSKSAVLYNGCYTSVADGASTTAYSSTGSSATCGTASSCSCTGSGSSKKCTGFKTKYKHYWRNIGNTDQTQTAAATADQSAWHGCVMDRNSSDNSDTVIYGSSSSTYPANSTTYQADQWTGCYKSSSVYLPGIVGMTDMSKSENVTSLKSLIDTMATYNDDLQANGTNQAIGLAWAWQTLDMSSSGPFPAPPKDANWVYKDYIVLVSDGGNTQDRWFYNSPNTQNTSTGIDARQALLCQNVKANGVTVFALQINTDKYATSQVLQNCAGPATNDPNSGSGSYFQMITSASQTANAFQNILDQIAKLRLAQ